LSTQGNTPLGAKIAYVHLAIAKLQEVFLSETNKILQGNNVRHAAASKQMASFE
jgi:hypothetical protein